MDFIFIDTSFFEDQKFVGSKIEKLVMHSEQGEVHLVITQILLKYKYILIVSS